MSDKIYQAVEATAELLGCNFNDTAKSMFVKMLRGYDQEMVLKALHRCIMEVKGKLTPADVIQRIDDGRPTANEAWAAIKWQRRDTCVLTTETMDAWRRCRDLHENDKVAARMAFIDTYNRLICDSRMKRLMVTWMVSIGTDKEECRQIVGAAAKNGKISPERLTNILKSLNPPAENQKSIETGEVSMPDDVRKLMSSLGIRTVNPQ